MDYARRQDYITTNHARGVWSAMRPKRSTVQPHRYLGVEERKRLLDACEGDLLNFCYLAMWTGARQSELLGLVWSDVHLEAGTIQIQRQLSRPIPGQPPKRVPTKTDDTRVVNIDSETVAFLRRLRAKGFAYGLTAASNYVLSYPRPLYHSVIRASFVRAVKRAELNPEGERPLRAHDLRRTFASILLKTGHSPAYVASQMGHSVGVLYPTYAGLLDAQDEAQRAMVTLLEARGVAS